jgi:threonine synthase
MTGFHWSLECSECPTMADAAGLPTVCPSCGAPWLVRYDRFPDSGAKSTYGTRPWSMWRYHDWMPLLDGEVPVTLGEGVTPMIPVPEFAREHGLKSLWIKDEALNATGSFKARGMSAAVTRAAESGAKAFSTPTAGNAGVALSAYGGRAGVPVTVFAPRWTPKTILTQIETFGADLQLIDGHIGDCGKVARAFAAEHDAFDVSTLREPYRIEGKKTMGLEVAESLGWHFPDALIYPTGGGTGLIGMWKVFKELKAAGWVDDDLPRLYSVQSEGCAPVVKAFEAGATKTDPWENADTVAWGLRVPAPLGGSLCLRALKETDGAAVAVSDAASTSCAERIAKTASIDASPEGGATLAALEKLVDGGQIVKGNRVVLFNKGAGWLYR